MCNNTRVFGLLVFFALLSQVAMASIFIEKNMTFEATVNIKKSQMAACLSLDCPPPKTYYQVELNTMDGYKIEVPQSSSDGQRDFSAPKTLPLGSIHVKSGDKVEVKGDVKLMKRSKFGFMKNIEYARFANEGYQEPMQPNLITCQDSHDTLSLTYSTTSNIGQPQFIYQRLIDGPGSKNVVKKGKDIRYMASIMGKVLTVTEFLTFDGPTSFISFVLPTINLRSNQEMVEFDSIAVETLAGNTIGGPNLIDGTVEKSRYFSLKCQAQIVSF